MIRPNPTAIPLRASDVKLLQQEIEKRRMESEPSRPDPTATSSKQEKSGERGTNQGWDAVSSAKEDRRGKTVSERIGL